MGILTEWITEWLKELLISGIMDNLEGLFDTVNTRVGEISVQVGTTPAAWNAGVFSLIRQLSETVILPIAGLILTFVATYELIQMILEKNNMHEFDVANIYKWVYSIIYADPPWRYSQKGLQGAAEHHYPTMGIDDLCALPVAELAAPDSALFLWATFPQLPEALRLIREWGFTYKSVAFVWLKKNRKADSWFYGLGFWTRGNAEICLLATKGHPKRQAANVHQFIISPIEAHSKKPDEARDKIVALMGDLPRVELFARQTPPGWDVWGNEVESTVPGFWSRWPEDSGKEDESCRM